MRTLRTTNSGRDFFHSWEPGIDPGFLAADSETRRMAAGAPSAAQQHQHRELVPGRHQAHTHTHPPTHTHTTPTRFHPIPRVRPEAGIRRGCSRACASRRVHTVTYGQSTLSLSSRGPYTRSQPGRQPRIQRVHDASWGFCVAHSSAVHVVSYWTAREANPSDRLGDVHATLGNWAKEMPRHRKNGRRVRRTSYTTHACRRITKNAQRSTMLEKMEFFCLCSNGILCGAEPVPIGPPNLPHHIHTRIHARPKRSAVWGCKASNGGITRVGKV